MKLHLLALAIYTTSFAMNPETNNNRNTYPHLSFPHPIFNKKDYQAGIPYITLSPQEITEHTNDTVKTLRHFNLDDLADRLLEASANLAAEKRKLEKNQSKTRLIEASNEYSMIMIESLENIEKSTN